MMDMEGTTESMYTERTRRTISGMRASPTSRQPVAGIENGTSAVHSNRLHSPAPAASSTPTHSTLRRPSIHHHLHPPRKPHNRNSIVPSLAPSSAAAMQLPPLLPARTAHPAVASSSSLVSPARVPAQLVACCFPFPPRAQDFGACVAPSFPVRSGSVGRARAHGAPGP